MRKLSQGGSQTSSTFAAVTPATPRTSASTSAGIAPLPAVRRSRRHFDLDRAVCADIQLVDQAEVINIHQYLGVMHSTQNILDPCPQHVRGGRVGRRARDAQRHSRPDD